MEHLIRRSAGTGVAESDTLSEGFIRVSSVTANPSEGLADVDFIFIRHRKPVGRFGNFSSVHMFFIRHFIRHFIRAYVFIRHFIRRFIRHIAEEKEEEGVRRRNEEE